MYRLAQIVVFTIFATSCTGTPPASRADSSDCSDLDNDPRNCGACGRTCIVAHATAGCALGECTVQACDEGFYDEDGDASNGCELQAECFEDSTCTTECGSTGTLPCTDGAFGECLLPDEQCNAIDDDCDEQCDEGAIAGCRAGVHRAFGASTHLYTTDLGAAGTAPFSVETANYFYLYNEQIPGSQVVFLCRKSDGTHLITSSTDCETLGSIVLTLGYWSTAQENCVSVPLYRLHNPTTNDHFFTTSFTEGTAALELGYVFERIAGYVWAEP